MRRNRGNVVTERELPREVQYSHPKYRTTDLDDRGVPYRKLVTRIWELADALPDAEA